MSNQSARPANGTSGAARRGIAARPERPAFGFALSSEENGPIALVRQARLAEEIGLDFLSISDHFHPWITTQGQSPAVWPVLGAIASVTDSILVGTGVTCPTVRLHPAIVAQAAATTAAMFQSRFYLGVGTGESLNEHVTGERWPSPNERFERLAEAVKIITKLWEGDSYTYDGAYFRVSDARLFTLPDEPPPILVAAAGPRAASLAGKMDGLIATGPDDTLFEAFETAGGRDKPRVGQVTVCWGPDEAETRRVARKFWPTTVLGWNARSEIRTPEVFEDATAFATEDAVSQNILCGPDIDAIVHRAMEFVSGGFDHVYFHQVGTRQEDFLQMAKGELLPELRRAVDRQSRPVANTP
ncbi:MAG: TIGR03557 family F420-dependent LLM class oxidoreductase [Dehalococcoidia bacterium]